MNDETTNILASSTTRWLARSGRFDFVLGIPSLNNEATIGHVHRTAILGLREALPHGRSLIVNSDTGSNDATVARFLETADDDDQVRSISTQFNGLPGKGSAIRAIVTAAQQVDARACLLFDADLRSVQPEWLSRLLNPIIDRGFDFVAPHYRRHPNDGTITNHLAYPLVCALTGQRVRQPIGGDFGLSRSLVDACLSQPVWSTDVLRFGIDIFLTMTAAVRDLRICSANLGAKVHDPKDPAESLAPTFVQVVGTLFSMAAEHQEKWASVDDFRDVTLVGSPVECEVAHVEVSIDRQREAFLKGLEYYSAAHGEMLTPGTLASIRDTRARFLAGDCSFDAILWRTILIEALRSTLQRKMDRVVVVRSLLPFYFGRVAGFLIETSGKAWDECERSVQAFARDLEQCRSRFVN